jgi:hypothetical protein
MYEQCGVRSDDSVSSLRSYCMERLRNNFLLPNYDRKQNGDGIFETQSLRRDGCRRPLEVHLLHHFIILKQPIGLFEPIHESMTKGEAPHVYIRQPHPLFPCAA